MVFYAGRRLRALIALPANQVFKTLGQRPKWRNIGSVAYMPRCGDRHRLSSRGRFVCLRICDVALYGVRSLHATVRCVIGLRLASFTTARSKPISSVAGGDAERLEPALLSNIALFIRRRLLYGRSTRPRSHLYVTRRLHDLQQGS
jgi:hypothetical protein